MDMVYINKDYHAYLKRIEKAGQFLWLSARGLEGEPTLLGSAIEDCKQVLATKNLPAEIFVEGGLPMYKDELERLQEVIVCLNILMAEFTDMKHGYCTTSHPETFEAMATSLYGDDGTESELV